MILSLITRGEKTEGVIGRDTLPLPPWAKVGKGDPRESAAEIETQIERLNEGK